MRFPRIFFTFLLLTFGFAGCGGDEATEAQDGADTAAQEQDSSTDADTADQDSSNDSTQSQDTADDSGSDSTQSQDTADDSGSDSTQSQDTADDSGSNSTQSQDTADDSGSDSTQSQDTADDDSGDDPTQSTADDSNDDVTQSQDDSSASDSGQDASSRRGEFIFPFEEGQTWVVCQGYNTPSLTHKGNEINSLDFSYDANAAQGGTGCSFTTANTSTGQYIYAPADGRLAWYGLDATPGIGIDVACLTLADTASNGANSLMVGHIDFNDFANTGDQVEQGDLIGVVNNPATMNGLYAHIHVSAYESETCSGESIPLDAVFGGNYNFTSNGSEQQWRGTKVTR